MAELTELKVGETILDLSADNGEELLRASPDHSVDAIVSNCALPATADRAELVREAFRALRPGGRLEIRDLVRIAPLREETRRDLTGSAQALADTVEENDYRLKLLWAGFDYIRIELVQVYRTAELRELLAKQNVDGDATPLEAVMSELDGKFANASIRTVKPTQPRGSGGCTCCS
jgi:SAM-dependent methyltransferase